MRSWLRKILILLPVILFGLFYLKIIYNENYSHTSFKRATGFIISILLLYLLFLVITIRKKQLTFSHDFILSSFFVYLFFVLQLTGYFILFREISSSGWWDKMSHRIETNDHVNLAPFKTIDIYDKWDRQIVGNFIMLLPLGIYLPLLYRKLRSLPAFFIVAFICFIVSISIELLQLATNYRSADVDDVILNTIGGCAGFIIYQLLHLIFKPRLAITS